MSTVPLRLHFFLTRSEQCCNENWAFRNQQIPTEEDLLKRLMLTAPAAITSVHLGTGFAQFSLMTQRIAAVTFESGNRWMF